MELPPFITALPALDMPFPPEIVQCYALASDDALGVFFVVHQDFEIPPHSHKAQWGTVLKGRFDFLLEGEVRTCLPGDSYAIPDGAEHGGKLYAGTIVFDVFEEPDRYKIKT